VRLEQSGVATAVIVTGEFQHEARLQREARGMAALRPVVVTHPISSLTLEQLERRAAEAAPQVRAIWTGAAVAQPAAEALGGGSPRGPVRTAGADARGRRRRAAVRAQTCHLACGQRDDCASLGIEKNIDRFDAGFGGVG
jgi:hypothetical protein